MTSTRKQQIKPSKRTRTQPSTYSAFDNSVLLVILTKIQKCLQDISKSKLQNISRTVVSINKDFNVISTDCRYKDKLNLLIGHLLVLDLVFNKKYQQAFDLIHKKQYKLNDKSHKILKLSLELLNALVLKYLQRQEQSRNALFQAMQDLDLSQFNVKPKSSDEKIVQTAILCITIIAELLAKFESQSFQYRQVYAQAYRIAYKYLTQYHKITETLFMICKKFPNQKTSQFQTKSKRRHFVNLKKRNSLNTNLSNRSSMKNAQSDRTYLNFTIQPQPVDSCNQILDLGVSIRRTSIPKRLKTIDSYADTRRDKQLGLTKLYGTGFSEEFLWDKNLLKNPKLSSSMKSSTYEPYDAAEMKQLNKISKLYLPKLQEKKKQLQNNKAQKLNALQVFKLGSTLTKLKPKYFDRIRTEQDEDQNGPDQSKRQSVVAKINPPQAKQTVELNAHQTTIKKKQSQFQSLPIQKNLKEKLLIGLSQQVQPQKQQNCQLI